MSSKYSRRGAAFLLLVIVVLLVVLQSTRTMVIRGVQANRNAANKTQVQTLTHAISLVQQSGINVTESITLPLHADENTSIRVRKFVNSESGEVSWIASRMRDNRVIDEIARFEEPQDGPLSKNTEQEDEDE